MKRRVSRGVGVLAIAGVLTAWRGLLAAAATSPAAMPAAPDPEGSR